MQCDCQSLFCCTGTKYSFNNRVIERRPVFSLFTPETVSKFVGQLKEVLLSFRSFESLRPFSEAQTQLHALLSSTRTETHVAVLDWSLVLDQCEDRRCWFYPGSRFTCSGTRIESF